MHGFKHRQEQGVVFLARLSFNQLKFHEGAQYQCPRSQSTDCGCSPAIH